jgi:hypothetical protein
VTIAVLVKEALAGNVGVTAIVGTRIYPLKLPQNPTYEAISYQRISNTGQDGTSTLRQSRWQFNCWAATYGDGQTLATAVKAALEEYINLLGIPGINMARVVNELDDWDEDSEVYRVMIDVILHTTGD